MQSQNPNHSQLEQRSFSGGQVSEGDDSTAVGNQLQHSHSLKNFVLLEKGTIQKRKGVIKLTDGSISLSKDETIVYSELTKDGDLYIKIKNLKSNGFTDKTFSVSLENKTIKEL